MPLWKLLSLGGIALSAFGLVIILRSLGEFARLLDYPYYPGGQSRRDIVKSTGGTWFNLYPHDLEIIDSQVCRARLGVLLCIVGILLQGISVVSQP